MLDGLYTRQPALPRSGGSVSSPILFPDGTAAAPSISFSSDPDTGIFLFDAGNPRMDVVTAGVPRARFNAAAFFIAQGSLGAIGIGTTVNADLYLSRDAANVFALRNGTALQTANIYGTYTSDSNYQRQAIKSAKATLSNVTGASVTATSLIPDGAFLIGVTTRVTTGLGTTNGTTGYTVGDGSDVDLWGAITGTAAGTGSHSADFTAAGASGTLYTSAQNVVITATTGNFDGTGVIEVFAHYMITEFD